MRSLAVALLVSAIGVAAVASSPQAQLGSAFADAYSDFARLEALHRSYGNHLFEGTVVAVPEGLGLVCGRLSEALQALQKTMIVRGQSQTAEGLGILVRLRMDGEGFCSTFDADLRRLDEAGGLSAEDEAYLVSRGFFASIRRLGDRFETALDAALQDAPDDRARWATAVTFAVRTMLINSSWTRVSADAERIFCGREPVAVPLPVVPDLVGEGFAAPSGNLNQEFENALGAALRDGPFDELRHAAAVAFALGHVAVDPPWAQMSIDLAIILRERAAGPEPLCSVPYAVRVAMSRIMALAGASLTDDERLSVREAAEVIYNHFMAGD